MMHRNRAWSIGQYPDALNLARSLMRTTWSLSTGFLLVTPEYGGLLLLNDSFTEDSITEYAVFRVPAAELPLVVGNNYNLTQMESLTTLWYPSADELAVELQHILDGTLGTPLNVNLIHVAWIGEGR